VTDDELDKAFLNLTETGELDKIFAQLRTAWDGLPREVVREALGDAMAEVVRQQRVGVNITNLPGLLQTVARRRLSKIWEATKRDDAALDQLAGSLRAEAFDPERADKARRAVDYVRTLIPKVDNENYQRTLIEMLDAVVARRQLTPKDLAQTLGCTANTASKWLVRAPDRLLVVLQEAGYDTLDSLLNLPPLDDDGELDDDEYHDFYESEEETDDE
jgi:DNA-directed RNA polymerase specialized sigma24 family protein